MPSDWFRESDKRYRPVARFRCRLSPLPSYVREARARPPSPSGHDTVSSRIPVWCILMLQLCGVEEWAAGHLLKGFAARDARFRPSTPLSKFHRLGEKVARERCVSHIASN